LRESRISIDAAYATLQIETEAKVRAPFRGNVVQLDPRISLIHGRFSELDKTVLAHRSIDLIFPGSDLTDPGLAQAIAKFALSYLRPGGFLVLYVKHNSVAKVSNTVLKHSQGLELVHCMSLPFDTAWLNADSDPVIHCNTALYLVFWKRKRLNPQRYLSHYIEAPKLIDKRPAQDNEDKIIRPQEANIYAVDHFLKSLDLQKGSVVCDPTCSNPELTMEVLSHGCEIICIQEVLETVELLKQNIAHWVSEQNAVTSSNETSTVPEDGSSTANAA
jgi:hypothetical protein